MIGWNECRNVEHNSSSVICLNLIQSWLEQCIKSHRSCHSETSQLPTRVIHVGSDENIPRLHISSGESVDYIALSHVWGDFHPLITTKANLEQRQKGIPLSSFPKTFQDAIILTRSLGIEYLWIDSLCIIQDDNLDWETEAARMRTVYSHALVTISVNDAKDAREGFLGPRGEMAHTSIAIPYATGPDLSSTSYVYARRKRIDIGAYIASTFKSAYTITEVVHTGEFGHEQRHKHFQPLIETRGWTFQERLLSPRTIHFTDYEMAFECRESLRCECSRVPVTNEYGTLFKVQTMNTVNHEKNPNWFSIVEGYTSRNLSVSTDRLPAISGVAAAMDLYTANDYFFGLWRQEFRTHLLWAVKKADASRRHPKSYAPTWSWAAVNSPVKYFFDRYSGWPEDEGFWAEIISLDAEKTSANPYGPGHGTVILRGLFGVAVVIESLAGNDDKLQMRLKLRAENLELGPELEFFPDIVENPEVVVGEAVFIFAVATSNSDWHGIRSWYLVLNSAGDSGLQTFRRVGLACTLQDRGFSSTTHSLEITSLLLRAALGGPGRPEAHIKVDEYLEFFNVITIRII